MTIYRNLNDIASSAALHLPSISVAHAIYTMIWDIVKEISIVINAVFVGLADKKISFIVINAKFA